MSKMIWWMGGGVAVALALGGGAATAQQAEAWKPGAKRIDPNVGLAQSRMAPTGPTPRGADGKVDFTGAWGAGWPSPFGAYGRRLIDTSEPDQATMQRGNQWNKPIYKPEFWDKVHALDFSEIDVDIVYNCGERGVPRLGPPSRIMQTGKEIWLLYGGDTVRVIQIGAKHEEDDTDYDTFNGRSVANWEGDTLVIDSVGFNDRTWLRWQGYFHSANMKVRETLRREGNLLYWQNTVTDPEVLAEPWTSDISVRRLNPNAESPEERAVCDERDAEGIVDRFYRG